MYLAPYERLARSLIPAEVERAFEALVIAKPDVGSVVPGLGGARKVRVAIPGRGKRAGARFLYFLRLARGRVYVLTAYTKNVQADLTNEQRKRIRQIVSDLR
ncbi:MAG: type II toxin-antitoxin system RelE/ParE family toxin [Candidatus Omnitrophota bacterium]